MNLVEQKIRYIVKKLLSEEVTSTTMQTIFNNHPGSEQPSVYFKNIIPKQYELKAKDGWWQNSCAAKMSHAMNKSGFSSGGQYKTEKSYKGLPAGSRFNPSSQAFKKIFRKHFGLPTETFDHKGDGSIPPLMKGQKGVYVFTTNAWGESAAGHVDAWDGTKSKGGDHFDTVGSYEFWTQRAMNTKNCGWGNDLESYKSSNWKCYVAPEVSKALKNARKCGWKDDLKGYRTSNWKCPK